MPRLTYIPIRDPKNASRFHPKLRALYKAEAFGAYIIRNKRKNGRVRYVGESSGRPVDTTKPGRMYHTITRHFQSWSGDSSRPTFDPMTTEIAIVVTKTGRAAIKTQDELISKLDPTDNIDPQQAAESDEVPF